MTILKTLLSALRPLAAGAVLALGPTTGSAWATKVAVIATTAIESIVSSSVSVMVSYPSGRCVE